MDIPPRPDAPIACDMRAAQDTPQERRLEYDRLFERELLGRERLTDAIVFRFRAGAREAVEDLARREAACCPFLGYRVESRGDEVVWTISGRGVELLEAVLPSHSAARYSARRSS